MKKKINIRAISEEQLMSFFLEHNIPKFRLKQLNQWLWQKNESSFDKMTNLSKEFRELLKNNFYLANLSIQKKYKSSDGTIKYSIKLEDNNLIESVLIPSKKRLTACISSQVGCSLDCNFCATGTLKLKRNLNFSEIFEQVYLINEEAKKIYGKKITNIVYMGMGEPLLNYNNVIQSINYITSKNGLLISPKRITISTVGIAKMIKKLADENVKFNLAISLHSAIQEKRNKLMPIGNSIPLEELKSAIKYFYQKTEKRITYEYILLNGVNYTIDDASALIKFSQISPCKINLIEYNNVLGKKFKKSTSDNTIQFIEFIKKNNLIVTLRRSKGEDVNAACGQLVNLSE